MRWSRPGTLLAVFVLVILAVGGLGRLAEPLSETAAVATLAVVVVALLAGVLLGTRRSGGPTNPYW